MAFIEAVTVAVYLSLCELRIYGIWRRQDRSIPTSQRVWKRVGRNQLVVHNARLVGEKKTRERRQTYEQKREKDRQHSDYYILVPRLWALYLCTSAQTVYRLFQFLVSPFFVSLCYEQQFRMDFFWNEKQVKVFMRLEHFGFSCYRQSVKWGTGYNFAAERWNGRFFTYLSRRFVKRQTVEDWTSQPDPRT